MSRLRDMWLAQIKSTTVAIVPSGMAGMTTGMTGNIITTAKAAQYPLISSGTYQFVGKYGKIIVKSPTPPKPAAGGKVIVPAGSYVTGPNGNEIRLMGQCLLDTVTGYGMLCPGGYVLF